MKKIYIKLMITLITICGGLILGSCISEAATASISASSKNVGIGDKVTITVSYEACLTQLKVSGAGISESITVMDPNLNNQKGSKTYKLDTSSAGSYTVKLTGQIAGSNRTKEDINKSVTVNVSEKSNTDKKDDSNKKNNNDNKKNDNNDNKDNNDTTEPTFKSANDKVYATGDINIRKNYSADSDRIGTLKAGESVTRTGISDNGWSKVSYNGGTGYIKTSLLTTEEPSKASDKALKTLEVTPEGLDPEFNPETTSYTLNVGADVEKLEIKAAPNDEKATVEITGNESLVAGDNAVKITVTAQDGTTRIYTINVKKGEEATLGLSSLKINGYTLSPKFESNVYEYKINVLDPNITKLDVSAVANDENATIEITGNTNIINGENVINITVTSQDGKETVTYQIHVTKNTVVANTNNKDIITYGAIVGSVILIVIIILIIVKHKKNKKYENNNQDEKLDDYSGLYGYSSKNLNSSTNKNDISNFNELKDDETLSKNINSQNDDIIYANQEKNINEQEKNSNEPQKPYISRDMYGESNEVSQKYDSNNLYDGLYGTYANDDGENTKAPVNENNNKNTYLEDKEDDYNIDNSYKIKKSRGKHSK